MYFNQKEILNLFSENFYKSLILIFANQFDNKNIINFVNIYVIDLNNYNFWICLIVNLIFKIFYHFYIFFFAIFLLYVIKFLYYVFKEHYIITITIENYCRNKNESCENKILKTIFYWLYLIFYKFNALYSKYFERDDINLYYIIEL